MIKFLVIFIIIFFISCKTILPLPSVKFVLINKTNKLIRIETFSKRNIQEIIKVEPFMAFDTSYSYSNKDNISITPLSYKTVDSLVIKFNSEKFIKFHCNGNLLFAIDRNDPCLIKKDLMQWANYGVLSKGNRFSNENIYTITIDNSDYEKAVPL